jgi:hypothetical protein
MAGMTIHIALESTIHIAGIRNQTLSLFRRRLLVSLQLNFADSISEWPIQLSTLSACLSTLRRLTSGFTELRARSRLPTRKPSPDLPFRSRPAA